MSKVAKKFHLDPDGYLTTKPDRELTTEEEATDAAEAAIGEALEEGGAIAEATEAAIEAALGEGGAIAEAIAASGGMIVTATTQTSQTEKQIDKTYEEVYNYVANGGYDAILVDKAAGGMVAHFLVCYGDASSGQIQFVATGFNGSRLDMTRYLMEPSKPGVVTYTQGQFMPAS